MGFGACRGGFSFDWPAAGIEAGSPQWVRGLAREARRRPWEPPQARWGSPRSRRTTAESPAAALSTAPSPSQIPFHPLLRALVLHVHVPLQGLFPFFGQCLFLLLSQGFLFG